MAGYQPMVYKEYENNRIKEVEKGIETLVNSKQVKNLNKRAQRKFFNEYIYSNKKIIKDLFSPVPNRIYRTSEQQTGKLQDLMASMIAGNLAIIERESRMAMKEKNGVDDFITCM